MTRRVTALDTFYGSPAEGIKKPGDVWDVTESRATELEKLGLVKVAKEKAESAKPAANPNTRETKPANLVAETKPAKPADKTK